MNLKVLPLLLTLLLVSPASAKGLGTFEDLQRVIIELSDRLKPSVVHVEVQARRADIRRKGLGSGLIITADGQIVTNHHVVDQAEYIHVILDDKTKYEARVLRKDKQTDLALLKIETERRLPAAVLADSDKVRVGEWVLAIGNPYGFDRTVSFGIVSGKGRYIPGMDNGVQLLNDFIQTDALIDPGSSGGPLINLRGEVIGINSVGIGRGQGFTIPSKVVKEVITRTEVEGRLERGWLGVFLQPFSREMAAYVGAPEARGVLVADVREGTPAEQAGLRSGDVILRFGQTEVEAEKEDEINRFIGEVTAVKPGTSVPVQILRDGKKLDLEVVVGTQPPVDAQEAESGFGMLVKEITYALFLEYRLEDRNGVLVSYVKRGGAADEADLKVGDVLTAIDGQPVVDLESFKTLVKDLDHSRAHLITLRRGKVKRFALVDLSRFQDKPVEDD